MLRHIFLAVVLVMCQVVPAFAAESAETLAASLDKWVPTGGKIVSVDKGVCVLDIGKDSRISKGMVFKVRRLGAELKHPLTGVSLGRKVSDIGTATVTEVSAKTSKAAFAPDNGGVAASGDIVGFTPPLGISFDFSGVSDRERADIKFTVLRSGVYNEDENGAYRLGCTKKGEGLSCIFAFGTDKIFDMDVVVASTISVTPHTAVKSAVGDAAVSAFAQTFNDNIVSVAVGRAYGKDKGITVAAAQKNNVYIYEYSQEKGLGIPRAIKGDFDSIVNIELVDINANGIDELVISNLKNKGETAHSYIYEFNGQAFKEKKFGIELLFRTFYAGGEKTLVCQEFADGDFSGRVFGYIHTGSEYEKIALYDNSLGMRIYGFAQGKFGSREGEEIISFSQTGELTLTNATGRKNVFETWFGDTTHSVVYAKTITKGVERANTKEQIVIYETVSVGYPVIQRILEVDTGKFLFSGNVPVARKTTGADDYRESFMGVYVLLNGKIDEVWKSESPMSPVIIESDIINIDGGMLVVTLMNNFGKKAGAFESAIYFTDIKKK